VAEAEPLRRFRAETLAAVAAVEHAVELLFWTSVVHAGAGSLLAAKAGAVVSDVDGPPGTIDSDSIVATATPRLHRELLPG
jgi:fructose-1,6-bisphosphatase/inositol monophosphatase family enzyme